MAIHRITEAGTASPDEAGGAPARAVNGHSPLEPEAAVRYLEDCLALIREDMDGGDVSPTPLAAAACRQLLLDLAGAPAATDRPGLPHISSSGGGDLLCEWRSGTRDLIAAISPQGRLSLYHVVRGQTAQPEAVANPTREDLAEAFAWFFSRSPAD